MDELCRRYWHPLYGYALRMDYSAADAEDATQEFFVKLLQNREMLNRADRTDRVKGRFRTYLLTSFKYFLADQYAKAMTQRRGGGAIHLSLETSLTGHPAPLESTLASHEESAEVAYERQWAEVLVERAKMEVRAEYEKIGKAAWFDRLGERRAAIRPTPRWRRGWGDLWRR